MRSGIGRASGLARALGLRSHTYETTSARWYDHNEVLRHLRALCNDPAEMAKLRREWFDTGLSYARNDERLLDDIARAICDGRLTHDDQRQAMVSSSATSSINADTSPMAPPPIDKPATKERPPGAPVAPPPSPEQKKTWIEFCLMDEETDKPISGVDFRIQLTDGSIVNHTTDGAGLIRIDNIDPGQCGIREITETSGAEVARVE